MSTFKQRFDNLQISWKMIIIYIGGIVIPILLVFSVFLWRMIQETNEREMSSLNVAIERTQKNVIDLFTDLSQVGIYFYADKELFSAAEEDEEDTNLDRFNDARILENRISIMEWAFPNINSVILYHSRSDFFNRDRLIYLDDDVKSNDWYQEYLDANQNFYYSSDYHDNDMFLVLITQFSDYIYETDDIIRQDISSRTITEALQDEYFVGESQVILLNPKNEVVATNQDIYSGFVGLQKFDEAQLEKNGDIYYVPIEYRSLGEGWQLVYLIEKPGFFDMFGTNIGSLLISMSIVFLISYLLVHSASNTITKRLLGVTLVMKEAQKGNLEKAPEDKSNDEIGTVYRSYNIMISRIKELLNEIGISKDKSDQLLTEKISAYEELASVNQELSASFEEIEIQDHKIQELIYSDLLTGLHNRFSITTIIEKGIADFDQELKAIIFIDVDNFKYINDTYGHDIGDKVISQTGKTLKNHETEHITIGRFGGDEFLIFAEGYRLRSEVVKLLEEIRDGFKDPVVVDDKKFYLTVSIGVTVCPDHGVDRNELIKRADMALYKSKNTGKNKYTFFDTTFDEGLERRITLQNAIKEAMLNNEFYLNYQPYVDSTTTKLKGFEALIRWNSDTLGQVSPFELITVAEEMGVIVEIGDWIIEEALIFIKEVNKSRTDKLTISINISAVQLLSKDFVDRLLGITNAIGINLNEICLEMTETVLIDSYTRSGKALQLLSNFGFGIALDDFGTGYSSLSYFKELPVTHLKIDKSFIDEISHSRFNKELVKLMSVIAHTKNIEVIAEGVESEEQFEILKDLQCDTIQGYYFSKPLSRQDAMAYEWQKEM